MAKITEKDVEYVAGLAQLALDDTEKSQLAEELTKILGHMESLNDLDTEGVEPMMHAMPLTNVFRKDVVEPSLPRDEALRNAPSHDGEYFLVPKILETEEG